MNANASQQQPDADAEAATTTTLTLFNLLIFPSPTRYTNQPVCAAHISPLFTVFLRTQSG